MLLIDASCAVPQEPLASRSAAAKIGCGTLFSIVEPCDSSVLLPSLLSLSLFSRATKLRCIIPEISLPSMWWRILRGSVLGSDADDSVPGFLGLCASQLSQSLRTFVVQGAVKPGEVFLAPSKYFAEGSWWDAAEDDGASGRQLSALFLSAHSYTSWVASLANVWRGLFVLASCAPKPSGHTRAAHNQKWFKLDHRHWSAGEVRSVQFMI